jgi:hypothetical protein
MGAREIIVLVIVAAGGYWAYENYFQGHRGSYQEAQWEKNAAQMRKCVDREITVARLSVTAGVAADEGSAEAACADRLDFYREDGHWKSYQSQN